MVDLLELFLAHVPVVIRIELLHDLLERRVRVRGRGRGRGRVRLRLRGRVRIRFGSVRVRDLPARGRSGARSCRVPG